ncbi:recombinase family protein [Actinoplanes flavus]|uniref:Recombinase family protein n=1 Tax=Actinoplanes flavus TaxID=2820290 RepID=A0ABS3UCQ4_9ACTN|nr:recombinase family protein [Actinoplanes flavus]MBO3736557.1 recombinase family protein [Actinoplanes flavus]
MEADLATANAVAPKLSFAFYGRVSTEDNQDPESSLQWQLSRARTLIAPHGGLIIAQFFDIGQSRALPWQRRPEASQLLAALKDPARGFDAVVIGEPHRAFYGNQYGLTMPLFTHYGVQLWVPEVGGRIDPDNEGHEMVMSVFGGMCKGERNRIKVRVRTSMKSQTKLEGRYLGGRPPYGYMLGDLGPHPNPAKAAAGKRLHGLIPDPQTAPVVQRIFAMYLDGYGLHAIGERLNRDGIPCPSAYDRARNKHRDGLAWAKSAIRVILNNPRYTGHQVWNRQRTDEVLLDVDDVALGYTAVTKWNGRERWIISDKPVHEPLVTAEAFEHVQQLIAKRGRTSTAPQRVYRSHHPYVFKGLVNCGVCNRRMQGSRANGIAYYRCRYPQEYALTNKVDHPRTVLLREDILVTPLDTWLSQEFGELQRRHTVTKILEQAAIGMPVVAPASPSGPTIAELDAKLARYREALDAGADPAVVAGWIAETQADRQIALSRQRLERTGAADGSAYRLTVEEVTAMIEELGGMVAVLKTAAPEDKIDIYRDLGLRMTYLPETKTVRADLAIAPHRWPSVCVRGGTFPPSCGILHTFGQLVNECA